MGIQGSGKTELAKHLIKNNFKHPLVYGVHFYEWEKEPPKVTLFKPASHQLSDFNIFCGELIKGLKDNSLNYDAVVIDEADLFFSENFQVYDNINDLFINHRHYPKNKGIALILLTRRPQDIPAKVVESCEHLFIFAVSGENVKRKLKEINPQIIELLENGAVTKEKHNCIYKHIDKPPIILKAICLKQIN